MPGTRFGDTGVSVGRSHPYYVTAFDARGDLSGASNTMNAGTPGRARLGRRPAKRYQCERKGETMKLGLSVCAVLLPFMGASVGRAAPSTQEDATSPLTASLGPVTRGQRVFSTGHSFHTGFAAVLHQIAQSAGLDGDTIVGISNIGGSKVVQHWGENKVQAALTAGGVDVLMTTPIYLPDPGVERFAQLGFEHNPDLRLTMMEFWLPFDNYEPRNYTDGPKGSPTEHVDPPRVNHDAATIEGLCNAHERYFREMDELARGINQKLGKQVVLVVPVGQAVIALRERIIAGKAPGLASQSDLFTDELGHPKPPLTILMAYCHYAVIYRRSPVGLPVPKELAQVKDAVELTRLLQELAWNAVSHHPLSGVTGVQMAQWDAASLHRCSHT